MVYCTKETQRYLLTDVGRKGATVDYVVEMISSSFRVKDIPLAKKSCGCGSSFEMKEE